MAARAAAPGLSWVRATMTGADPRVWPQVMMLARDQGAEVRTVDELRQSWDWQLYAARDFDASCDNDRTWPPPMLTALTAAVQATTLRRRTRSLATPGCA